MREPVKFGDYYLFERVAVGGMAEVFRGVSYGVEGFERLFAIKRVLPNISEDQEFIEMFIDEAKIAVQLTHANIGQIFELGNADGSYFIAMEFVQGKDLRALFDRARARGTHLDVPMCCHLIKEVCEALEYAHSKRNEWQEALNLIHRDVSPQNIIVSYDGEVKLIDFGIAKAAGKASKTQAGILKGKFGYMSPEQVRGKPIDRRSDLFSLAVVLYELLTLERCFQGESDFSTLEKVRNVDVRRPTSFNRDIPPELERILMRGLSRNPNERYQSAAEFQDALQKFLYQSGAFYARKDLAAFMRRTFDREMTEEASRLAEFREFARRTIPEARRPSSLPDPEPATASDAFRPNLPNLSWEDEELETHVWDRSPSQVVAEQALAREAAGKRPSNPSMQRSGSRPRTAPPPFGAVTGSGSVPALRSAVGLPALGTPVGADPAFALGGPSVSPDPLRLSAPPPMAPPRLGAPNRTAPPSWSGGPAQENRYQPADLRIPPLEARRGGAGGRLVMLVAIALLALVGGFFAVQMLNRKPALATVQVRSEPSVVTVHLNGKEIFSGLTPTELTAVPPGEHRLRISAEGRQPVEQTITVVAGERKPIEVILARAGDAASLEIETTPGGAKVFIDDILIDESPLKTHDVKPGERRLRVEKTGFLTYQGRVEVTAGQPTRVEPIRLLPAKVAVSFMPDPDDAEIRLELPNGQQIQLGRGSVSYEELENLGRAKVVAKARGYDTLTKALPQYREPKVTEFLMLKRSSVAPAPAVATPTPRPTRASPPTPRPTPSRPPPDRPRGDRDGDCIGEDCPGGAPVRAVVLPTPDPPPDRPVPAVEQGSGYLKLMAQPPARAFVGGKDLGWTPLYKQELPVGTHQVTLVREDAESPYRESFTVVIRANETTFRKFTRQ